MNAEPLELWGEIEPKYGESEFEASIRAQIDEKHAESPLTLTQRVHARLAMALAKNISLGNGKGRAIGNEAAQLSEQLKLIFGEEDTGPDLNDKQLQDMFDAFRAPTPARPDTAPAGHDVSQL